jgi:membrane-associated phospholipid phosphatase
VFVNRYVLAVVLAIGLLSSGSAWAQVEAPPVEAQLAIDQQDPPIVAGEEEKKPTRGFLSALGHNLVDDLKHLPRRNSAYWLAGGAGLALAVHPADQEINAYLVDKNDAFWAPGKVIGSTAFVLSGSVATYVIGRLTDEPRVQHLGMDLIEATLLAEGLSQGIKLIVRRDRPPQVDGNQSSTYSFPSGHATVTFAAATVLQQHLGYRAAIPTYAVATYVGISRLHDNRHYASDVVFGAALGIVVGRTVTFHGRNYYASPMLLRDGVGIQFAMLK